MAENETTPATQTTNPDLLIQLAISQNVDIEKLERLLALKERWDQAQAKKSFLSALASFQKQLPPLKKTKRVNYTTRDNRQVDYKFAPLGEIDAAIKEPLSACGLTKRWEIKDSQSGLSVSFIVSHIDGHSEITTMTADADNSGGKNSIQQRGSTITYLQRYTMIAGLGIATADEDTDGSENPEGAEVKRERNNENKTPNNGGEGDKKQADKNDAKPWLNRFIDNNPKKGQTKIWDKVVDRLTGKALPVTTVKELLNHYRISKVNKEVLDKIEKEYKEQSKKPGNDNG